jgi:flavin-dependent dehydrogenase
MKYDAVIVGAGPAGSTAAKIVAERGFNVLVLEKDTLNREKPCGGAITHRVVEYFKIPKNAFARKSSGIFLCSPKNRTAVIDKHTKNVRLVMRSDFDKILSEMAIDKGARFFESSLVLEPSIKDGEVVGVKARINGEAKAIEGRLIIGASTLASKLGLYSGNLKTIAFCFQYQMKLSNDLIEQRIGNNIEVYFGSEWIPFGYT